MSCNISAPISFIFLTSMSVNVCHNMTLCEFSVVLKLYTVSPNEHHLFIFYNSGSTLLLPIKHAIQRRMRDGITPNKPSTFLDIVNIGFFLLRN